MRSILLLLTTLLTFAHSALFAQGDYNMLTPENFSSYNKKEGIKVAYVGGIETFTTEIRDEITAALSAKFSNVECIESLQPAIGSVGHAFSMQKFLYSKGTPDILILESTADDIKGKFKEQNLRLSYEGIVRKALTINPNMDIFFVSIADDNLLKKHNEGGEVTSIKVQKEIAEYYGANVLELSRELSDKIKSGEIAKDDSAKIASFYGASIANVFDSLMKDQKRNERDKLPKELEKKCFQYGDLAAVKEAANDPLFVYEEKFSAKEGVKSYENYIDIPAISGSKSKSSFFYEFKGTAIGVVFLSGPDAGMIEYVVNRGKIKMYNLFRPESKTSYQPIYMLTETDLTGGGGYVAVGIIDSKSGESSGNMCRVIYFMTNSDK